jgi:hypothetical protein
VRRGAAIGLGLLGVGAVAGAVTVRRALDAAPSTGVVVEGRAVAGLSGAPGTLPDPPSPRSGAGGPARLAPPWWEPAPLRALARWEPDPPASGLGRALAYSWAAPMTLAGLLAGAASGAVPVRRDGVLLFAGARGLPRAFFGRRGFSAFALGHVVVALAEEPSEPLLVHELVHVRQAERLGVLMAPLYLALQAAYG